MVWMDVMVVALLVGLMGSCCGGCGAERQMLGGEQRVGKALLVQDTQVVHCHLEDLGLLKLGGTLLLKGGWN